MKSLSFPFLPSLLIPKLVYYQREPHFDDTDFELRTAMDIEMVESSDVQTLQAIFRLRAEVWRSIANLPPDFFPQGMWTDFHDDHALHWAVKNGREVVASARLCIHQTINQAQSAYLYDKFISGGISPIAIMNRLVVHFDARKCGLSKKLDAVRILAARKNICKLIVVGVLEESGVNRIKCLEDQGFQIVGHTINNAEPPTPLSPATILALDL